MGKSSDGGSTQTTQTSQPWAGVQPYLAREYANANALQPKQVFPGQWTANSNFDIATAQNTARDRVVNGDPLMQQAGGYASGVMNGNYLDSNPSNDFYSSWKNGLMPQSPAYSYAYNLANGGGRQSPVDGYFANLTNTGGAQNPANQYFNFVANHPEMTSKGTDYWQRLMGSSADETQNPFLGGMVNAATRGLKDTWQNTVAPSVASMFGASGRTGSGAMGAELMHKASPLMNSIQDVSSNIYGHAYDTDAARRDLAATSMDRSYQFDASRRDTAANQVENMFNTMASRQDAAAGMYNTMFNTFNQREDQANVMMDKMYDAYNANQFGAASGLAGNYNFERGLQNSAMNFAPQEAANDRANIQTLFGMGDYQRQMEQQNLDAQHQMWDQAQNAPYQLLAAQNALYQGGLNFNTTSGNQQQTIPRNPFMGAMGGAMMGSAFGPIGMAGGALLGGLFA